MHKILIIDDEANIRKILSAMLKLEGYEVAEASTLLQAKASMQNSPSQAVLCDLRLGSEDGLSYLKWIREQRLQVPVVILTAHGTVDTAVDAMKQGAFDYLLKPFERSELVGVIKKAVMTYQYQNPPSEDEKTVLTVTGSSPKVMKIFSVIDKVAPTDSTVLITGESGTGKELIAQALFEKSHRKDKPFIKINCAAIPQTLMESELFGYERGAFTGAVQSKPGRFELADGGTLFLDEIGEMSPDMQVKLLRALQERAFERVGGIRTIQVNVRLIAATNLDLDKAVKEGKFRSDLYYRLNVVPIHVPPLRERPDDIPTLTAYFMNKSAKALGRLEPTLHPETLELLCQFPWPGNIRQLENAVERLIVMNEGGVILPEYLPEEILDYEEERFLRTSDISGSLKDRVRDVARRVEKQAIEEALNETGQNVTRAARLLNISRKGLQLKMKELGLRC